MIISCPACESRFNIDPDRVPASGRQVRCGKCGHVWRIAADGSPVADVTGNPSAPEQAVTDGPSRFSVGRSTPPADEPSAMEDGSLPPPTDRQDDESPETAAEPPLIEPASEPSDYPADTVQDSRPQPAAVADTGATAESSVAGKTDGGGDGDEAEGASGAADTGSDARPVPPLLGSTMTPNARQKLAEARKGRSRVRFLVIALVLMVVAALAVSFIRRHDSLNDALRMVPGLDENSPAENSSDETAGDDAQ